MKKPKKTRFKNFFLLFGLSSILLFSTQCDFQRQKTEKTKDSLFLQSAYAQDDTAEIKRETLNLYDSRHTAITRAAAKAGPAVVGINVIQVKRYIQRSPFSTNDPFWKHLFPEYFQDRVYEQPIESLGSGFIISPSGYIVTNEHVVANAEKIIVTLSGGEQHDAELIGTDRDLDIALLKIDGKDIPYLEFGSSNDLIVGEWVIALGNPFGLFELNDEPTVTAGVISAINRDWGRSEETGRIYKDMIQTDAAINHGNSGGPLVNSLGQVIGMNTLIYTPSRYQQGFIGIGFAIPIDRVRKIVEQIKKEGGVNRNYWLGFRVQNLNRIMIRALGLDIDHGVIVTNVESGSSADKSGLQPEDIILSVEDQAVQNSRDLLKILNNTDLQVGSEINLEILRNKKPRSVNLKLIEKS